MVPSITSRLRRVLGTAREAPTTENDAKRFATEMPIASFFASACRRSRLRIVVEAMVCSKKQGRKT